MRELDGLGRWRGCRRLCRGLVVGDGVGGEQRADGGGECSSHVVMDGEDEGEGNVLTQAGRANTWLINRQSPSRIRGTKFGSGGPADVHHTCPSTISTSGLLADPVTASSPLPVTWVSRSHRFSSRPTSRSHLRENVPELNPHGSRISELS